MIATAAPTIPTRVDHVVDTLHGVKVADPYRWLEDGTSPEVVAWTDAQNAHTRRVLDAIPGRAALEARFWSLHEIGSLGAPVPRPLGRGRSRGWRYFYTRRDGKQNQPVLYARDGLDGVDRALVDVNAMASDGTRSLDWWFPSEDGRLIAYGVSADGSEESVLRVRDVVTGRDLSDAIPRTRACSVAWLPDGGGFFYTRYPALGAVPAGEETYHRHVFFHRLDGASSDEDRLIFGAGRDMKDWPSVSLSPDGRFLAIEISQGWSKTELYVLDRATGYPGTLLSVAVGQDAIFDLSEIVNDALFIRTNEGAPRYRLFRVPLPPPPPPLAPSGRAHRGTLHVSRLPQSGRKASGPGTSAAPGPVGPMGSVGPVGPMGSVGPVAPVGPLLPRSSWRELIAEGPHALQQVALVGKTLAALYLEDAVSRVRLLDIAGVVRGDVALPNVGTVGGIHGHLQGIELFLPFTSFVSPTTILRQTVGAERLSRGKPTPRSPPPATIWRQIPSPVSPDAFAVVQDHFTGKDGTQIPLFLVHRNGLLRDGNTPTLLYGYGGFNVNVTPAWAPSVVPFLEAGGVYAVAVLRGGGEYGEDWHQAGMLGRKQTVFDDFIAAAEHLIAAKVTRPGRLAIMGRSNGGLLVGAAMTQRPELFAAVVCGVPLLDMLRYHAFRIAKLWIPEYGSADDADAFRWLFAYSPYHNVKDGVAYPAALFVTAASDTRVDPLHARKMTARLQAASRSNRPTLLRLETQAGHGAGKPLSKVISQLVDEWSFLFAELGLR